MPQRTATIQSGAVTSDDIDLRGVRRLVAISCPALTSGDLIPRGSFDQTSASFVRLVQAGASGDLRFPVGPGSAMALWPESLRVPSFMRLEMSTQQAAPREFTIRFSSA